MYNVSVYYRQGQLVSTYVRIPGMRTLKTKFIEGCMQALLLGHPAYNTCNHIAWSNLHMRPERVTSKSQTNPIVSQPSILKSKLSFVLNCSPIALIFRQNQSNPSPKLTSLCQTPLFSVIRMSKSVICLNKTRMTLKAF